MSMKEYTSILVHVHGGIESKRQMDGCLSMSMEAREYEADGWIPSHVHGG